MKVYLVWERWSGVSNGRICWYLTCASEQVSLWFASLTVERTTELTTETWDSSHQHSKHEQSCYLTSPGLCCLSLNVSEMMTRLAGTWITSDCLVVVNVSLYQQCLQEYQSEGKSVSECDHTATQCLHLLCLEDECGIVHQHCNWIIRINNRLFYQIFLLKSFYIICRKCPQCLIQ